MAIKVTASNVKVKISNKTVRKVFEAFGPEMLNKLLELISSLEDDAVNDSEDFKFATPNEIADAIRDKFCVSNETTLNANLIAKMIARKLRGKYILDDMFVSIMEKLGFVSKIIDDELHYEVRVIPSIPKDENA